MLGRENEDIRYIFILLVLYILRIIIEIFMF